MKVLNNIPVFNPAIYNEWISCNPMKLKNGKNFEATIECYKNLRENTAVPLMLLPKKTGDIKKTLVLDLDETLVHSSFTYIEGAQITVPIEIENNILQVYVKIRPGAKYFIEEISKYYEIVIFTASISRYAEPLINNLDPKRLCEYRLFREHCTVCSNIFIKDLVFLGRDLKDVIIVDNSPNAYAFQTENALPILSWYSDENDTSLYQLLPILQKVVKFDDTREILDKIVRGNIVDFKKAYRLLKIDHDFNQDYEDYFDSFVIKPDSELEKGPKEDCNTPTENQIRNSDTWM